MHDHLWVSQYVKHRIMNRLNPSFFSTSGALKRRNSFKGTASRWSGSGRNVRENQTKGVRAAVIERWKLGRQAVTEWQRSASLGGRLVASVRLEQGASVLTVFC